MSRDLTNLLLKETVKQTGKISGYCMNREVPVDDAVHEIRKSFKRLRAIIPLFPEEMGEKLATFSKDIGAFGRQLTDIRESLVNLSIFREMIMETGVLKGPVVIRLENLLSERNKKLANEMYIVDHYCLPIRDLISGLDSILQETGRLKITDSGLIGRADKSYKKALKRFEQIDENSSAEEYHSLRKDLKVLWYQLTTLIPLSPDLLNEISDQLHKITELLGNDHDLYVFTEEIKKESYGLSSDEYQAIEKHISGIQKSIHADLSRMLSEFFKQQESFGHVLAKA